jgi:hypothetical protein
MGDQNVERLSQAVGVLWAEQQAHHIVLVQVIGSLAQNSELKPAIKEGFERALGVAQAMAEGPPDAENPQMGIKALRIIEDIRATLFGKEKPKKGAI